jgi:hypothetical protein
VRAAYRRWFQFGEENGSELNLSNSLREAGRDPQRVLSIADRPDSKATLLGETDKARSLGIFGSPTFVVGRSCSGVMTVLTTLWTRRSTGTFRYLNTLGARWTSRRGCIGEGVRDHRDYIDGKLCAPYNKRVSSFSRLQAAAMDREQGAAIPYIGRS